MAKAKVLHKRLKVDEAGKSHKCQHNGTHIIKRGDKRLKVTEGRTDEHYCLKCASKFLNSSIASLQGLLDEIDGAIELESSASDRPPIVSTNISFEDL